jgi:hypothetical protein
MIGLIVEIKGRMIPIKIAIIIVDCPSAMYTALPFTSKIATLRAPIHMSITMYPRMVPGIEKKNV